jgi:LmbE family N-acetylglucosaminyl deacetylase
MRVLAIGAHADDVELGCGGTLARWASEGNDVHICVVTDSAYANPKGELVRSEISARSEAEAAARMLGAHLHWLAFPCLRVEFDEPLNAALLRAIEETSPDVVLTHWTGDTHHDHRVVAHSTLHAARHLNRILAYRSNWYPGPDSFQASLLVDISSWFAAKLELVRAHRSEHGRAGDRWETFLQAEAGRRGLEAGCDLAEGFLPIRWVL